MKRYHSFEKTRKVPFKKGKDAPTDSISYLSMRRLTRISVIPWMKYAARNWFTVSELSRPDLVSCFSNLVRD